MRTVQNGAIPFGHAPTLKLYHDLEARFLHCRPTWRAVQRLNGWQQSIARMWLDGTVPAGSPLRPLKRPAFLRRYK